MFIRRVIVLVCRLLAIRYWEYFSVKYKVDSDLVKETTITHRRCRITGREEREVLPRCQGYARFEVYKQ